MVTQKKKRTLSEEGSDFKKQRLELNTEKQLSDPHPVWVESEDSSDREDGGTSGACLFVDESSDTNSN